MIDTVMSGPNRAIQPSPKGSGGGEEKISRRALRRPTRRFSQSELAVNAEELRDLVLESDLNDEEEKDGEKDKDRGDSLVPGKVTGSVDCNIDSESGSFVSSDLLHMKRKMLLAYLGEYLKEFHGEKNEIEDNPATSNAAAQGDTSKKSFQDGSSSMGKITISFQPYSSCHSDLKFDYDFEENNLHQLFEGLTDIFTNRNHINRCSMEPKRKNRQRLTNKETFDKVPIQKFDKPQGFRDFENYTVEDEDDQQNLDSSKKNYTRPKRRPTITPEPATELHSDVPRTEIRVVSDEEWLSDDEAVGQAKEFDEGVLSKITTLEESQQLLRRTRAVSALASRLMTAPDEESCYELVSRLLVPIFEVDCCSFALLKDAENVIVKQITAKKKEHVLIIGDDNGSGGLVKALEGTAAGVCAKTLKQHYTPHTMISPFDSHKIIHSAGLNTVLVTPILVNGNKFVGCIIICMAKEDAFRKCDRILVNDVAAMLGANIYSKRMRQAAERSNTISREMLHSMIPAKVIQKIECFWDVRSEQYWRRRSSVCSASNSDSGSSSLSSSFAETAKDVNDKISFLNSVERHTSDPDADGVIIGNDIGLTSTPRALYAETVNNVCIIFLDIVGFSKFSMKLKPIQVMDMLHDLFGRYDALCDKHDVLKLETIGDAYVCATNLLKDKDKNPEDELMNAKIAALHALEMSKDMVLQAESVIIPKSYPRSSVQVRVGIHIGQVTCGVLGERLPKFTVLGKFQSYWYKWKVYSVPFLLTNFTFLQKQDLR